MHKHDWIYYDPAKRSDWYGALLNILYNVTGFEPPTEPYSLCGLCGEEIQGKPRRLFDRYGRN